LKCRFWTQKKVGQDEEAIKSHSTNTLAPIASISMDGACVLVHSPDKAEPRIVEGDTNTEHFLRALQYNQSKEVRFRICFFQVVPEKMLTEP
jgi:hypothetical protein